MLVERWEFYPDLWIGTNCPLDQDKTINIDV
jgi:hypothetical protein